MAERMIRGRRARAVGLGALLALVVAACQQQPLPGVDPTPPRAAPPPSTSGQPAQPVTSQPAPALNVTGQTSVPVTTIEEDSSGWNAPDTDPNQHQADLDSCYAFANAQVRHDEQINDDRAALFGSYNAARGNNLYSYERAIRPYGAEQRFGQLFSSCMSSRGYQQN